jgi:hypothetical protein
MLEPYEGKLSRTVLRGLETGNGLRLLGSAIVDDLYMNTIKRYRPPYVLPYAT